MPTQPIPHILPLELDSELASDLKVASDLIKETVYFGTHVLQWFEDANKGSKGHFFLPPYLLFRRALEVLDSISILVKASEIDPCRALLRALLEVAFSLEYILQTDTERRSLSFFLVCRFHEQIKTLRKADKSTQQGKQFRTILKKDRLLKDWPVAEIPNGEKEATSKELALVNSPDYSECEAEYQRIRKLGKDKTHDSHSKWNSLFLAYFGKRRRRSKNPKWYSLFDGPQSIEQLGREIGLPGVYAILYSDWSNYVHGNDMFDRNIISMTSESVTFIQLRSAVDFQFITRLSIGLATLIYETFVARYVKDRLPHVTEWYAKEIEDSLDSLVRLQINWQ